MFLKSLFRSAVFLILVCGVVHAQPTETRYQPQTETNYQSRAEISHQSSARAAELLANTETAYNPQGTYSSGSIALLSNRRDSPEYPAFQLGMQAASIKSTRLPLNVAPSSAKTLGEQAEALANPDIRVYLVDSPDPVDSKDFFEKSKLLGRKAVLISERLPSGYYPPVVVDSPILYAERAAEEAIRTVGDVEVEIAYITGDDISEGMQENLVRAFRKPFNTSAPKIKINEIDPQIYSVGLVPPPVVCVLSSEASRQYSTTLRKQFPESTIICVGEGPETIAAFENQLINIRLRPDYLRLLGNAMREAEKRSDMPIIVHPTMDKWWESTND